ncbi:hypothetical protein NDU88_008399 [Pleurodeles waltl]|uniref:Uncharacterized protein n=1 Tax=Pleurodeles waltl TaxID=8319 RepID=A0AAV7N4V4_PLEWA|nr:hypothetical protein NDU88_008399 [Pleurodeles waltl]
MGPSLIQNPKSLATHMGAFDKRSITPKLTCLVVANTCKTESLRSTNEDHRSTTNSQRLQTKSARKNALQGHWHEDKTSFAVDLATTGLKLLMQKRKTQAPLQDRRELLKREEEKNIPPEAELRSEDALSPALGGIQAHPCWCTQAAGPQLVGTQLCFSSADFNI